MQLDRAGHKGRVTLRRSSKIRACNVKIFRVRMFRAKTFKVRDFKRLNLNLNLKFSNRLRDEGSRIRRRGNRILRRVNRILRRVNLFRLSNSLAGLGLQRQASALRKSPQQHVVKRAIFL